MFVRRVHSYHYFIISKKVIMRTSRIPAIREKQAMQCHYYFISRNGYKLQHASRRDSFLIVLRLVIVMYTNLYIIPACARELEIAT